MRGGGGEGGGGGGGGVGGVSRLRFPPGPHLRRSRFSRHPRLRQAPTRRFAENRNLRGLWFCGEKAPGPWWPRPQAPWRPGPQAPVHYLKPMSRAATITPNPLTLGGVGWFPKAELYSPMRGGVPVFAPAFQPLGRAPRVAHSPCSLV